MIKDFVYVQGWGWECVRPGGAAGSRIGRRKEKLGFEFS